MVNLTKSELETYQCTQDGAYFSVENETGYLRLSGETRVDFLHKQTTNDLKMLTPQRSIVTVLTSPTARILDVMQLVDEGDAIGIVPLAGRVGATLKFLRSRIFFMDKVSIADVSADCSIIELGGVGAAAVIDALGCPTLDEGRAASIEIGESAVRIVRAESSQGSDFIIIASAAALPAVTAVFQQCGAAELTPNLREVLRIERGLPSAATELTEGYTPLEAGLRGAIADSKGCYTGQEIIARQLTYDKVVQRLVGLRVEEPVQVGEPLFAGDRRVGVVTSLAVSPRFGLIALGYVRKPDFEPGTILSLAQPGDAGKATVVEIPFSMQ